MNIISLKWLKTAWVAEVITKDYHTWKIIENENWERNFTISPWWWNWLLWYLIHQKELDWEYWIDKLLHYLKNIKVTEEEFKKRIEFDNDPSKHSWPDKNWEFHWGTYMWDTPYYSLVRDNSEYYTDEEISWVVYQWWGWEVYFADSYKDLTYVYNYIFWERKWEPEIYSTTEVIEVLERWKEALERWNNPEERKKMIEEY
jgi:hypothetical protein